jgi:hypothetical protein
MGGRGAARAVFAAADGHRRRPDSGVNEWDEHDPASPAANHRHAAETGVAGVDVVVEAGELADAFTGRVQHGMPEEVGAESAAGHRCSSDGGAQWMVLVATDRPATRATVTRCQIARTFSACGPFWPATVSNSTRWLSSRLL